MILLEGLVAGSHGEATQRSIERARESCDEALVHFQRSGSQSFREPRLRPFAGAKLSIAQLCAQCGLEYRDGLVHTPPLELRRAA